jgi:hypothetical protein
MTDPTPSPWGDITELAELVGVPEDDARLVKDLAVSIEWCQRKRNNLPKDEDPGLSIRQAVHLYASLMYQQRANPQGFPGYSSTPELSEEPVDAMAQVYRLLGRRLVAR